MKITIEDNGVEEVLEFLSPVFLRAMNDIGHYGFAKYGENSFQARRMSGKPLVRDPRTKSVVIADHAREHFSQYLSFIPHDHFGTNIHQVAASAFNCMMESVFAGLDKNDEGLENPVPKGWPGGVNTKRPQ